MAEHDDGSPRLLSCGVHTSHSPVEEKRWTSTEFCTETERQQKLFPSLIAYLKRKALITPGLYPPVPNTWNTQRIYEAKQHFAFLRTDSPAINILSRWQSTSDRLPTFWRCRLAVAILEVSHSCHQQSQGQFRLPICPHRETVAFNAIPTSNDETRGSPN